MSNTVTAATLTGRWMPTEELQAMGFEPSGPEIDYGMRWGEHRNVRVSFAPHDESGGYLYAHDSATDQALLLATHTTASRVDAAWQELTASTSSPDGYLALAALDGDDAPMPVKQSRELLFHCIDREMDAYTAFTAAGTDVPTRFDLAHALIVKRSARIAAEGLHVDAARAVSEDREPVVIRYRVLAETSWTGRLAATNLDTAASDVRHVLDLAEGHHLTMQPTSVSHGHSTVAAARVPELDFAVHRREPPSADRGISL
jgi:hypothetical protein